MALRLKDRITKAEALSFLLTHIVIERGRSFEVNQLQLFNLTNLAQRAVEEIGATEAAIPHEVIENLASEFLEGL